MASYPTTLRLRWIPNRHRSDEGFLQISGRAPLLRKGDQVALSGLPAMQINYAAFDLDAGEQDLRVTIAQQPECLSPLPWQDWSHIRGFTASNWVVAQIYDPMYWREGQEAMTQEVSEANAPGRWEDGRWVVNEEWQG